MVSVHLGYTAGSFHCRLDSELFLPQGWANDPARREEVGIPDDVHPRTQPVPHPQRHPEIRRAAFRASWFIRSRNLHSNRLESFLQSRTSVGSVAFPAERASSISVRYFDQGRPLHLVSLRPCVSYPNRTLRAATFDKERGIACFVNRLRPALAQRLRRILDLAGGFDDS